MKPLEETKDQAIALNDSEAQSMQKQKLMIIALLLAIGMTQIAYLNIATFLPLYIVHTHTSISST